MRKISLLISIGLILFSAVSASADSLLVYNAVTGEETGADFQKRVEYYMIKAASAIIGENPETSGHAKRFSFARRVLQGNASIRNFALAVATNPTIAAAIASSGAAAIPDGDIEFAVNSLWDDFSGHE